MKPRIVVLDGAVVNPGDISWDPIGRHGNLVIYDHTDQSEIVSRLKDANITLVNKVVLSRSHFETLPRLKYIGLLATGFDNVDVAAARDYGITVSNAVDYGSASVAQYVFALILAHVNRILEHNAAVQNGEWAIRPWSFSLNSQLGLAGRTIGIIGFGKIGHKVAQIAKAFGMNILVYSRTKQQTEGIDFVSLRDILKMSDVLTLHIPLNADTHNLIYKHNLELMKPNAILVNTSRGAIINESDLREHLIKFSNFVALLDVLSIEPPPIDHPLIGLPNCIITPHNAWSNKDARIKLIQIAGQNIEGFIKGHPINEVIV